MDHDGVNRGVSPPHFLVLGARIKRTAVEKPGSRERTCYCMAGQWTLIGTLLSNTSEGSMNRPLPMSLFAACKTLHASG